MATRVGMKIRKEPVTIPAPAEVPAETEAPKVEKPRKVTKRGSRKKTEK